MAFTVPSFAELRDRLVAAYRNAFPLASLGRTSDNYKRQTVTALAVTDLHAHIDDSVDQLLPDRALDTRLDRWGTIVNVARKQATPATKAAALRVTGTLASTVSIGDLLTHVPTGLRFQVNSAGEIPAGGFVDVDVLAIDTGSQTRLAADEVLTFDSPPAGIETEAELQLDIDEDGDDVEADGAYRERILDKLAEPGMGGNKHDYEVWALQVTGIATAYVYPLRQGLGSVDVVGLHGGRGADRLLTEDERDELEDWIDALRPVDFEDFRALTVTAEPQNVEATVEPEGDEDEFDWDDETPLEVLAWTVGTRTLQFTTARPADMVVGDRLVIKNTTTYNDGATVEIESLSSTDSVVLVAAPVDIDGADVDPEVGAAVYAGGPLTEPCREAVLEHMDTLGPGLGDHGTGWEGTLRTAKLFRAVQLTEGVLDSEIVTPAANVAGTNTAPNNSVGLVTPRQVIVRRRW